MKKIFLIIVLLVGFSCQNDTINLFTDLTERGGFIEFKNEPTLKFNFLELGATEINEELIDPNNNVTNYSLSVTHEGTTVDDFVTISSFPSNLVITLPMLYEAFSITEADLELTSKFEFNAIVTTPTGTFNGVKPDFNDDTNEQEGGTTTSQLLGNGFNNALTFSLSFVTPPPKKIRGTSFEEGFAGTGVYRRADGTPRVEGLLLNNPDGGPDVMYTAVGTGVDDEIGFTAEFAQFTPGTTFSDGVGGPDGTEMGISDNASDVGGAFVDGVQGYRLEDTTGPITLTFDRVAVPDGIADSGVQIQFFLPNPFFESSDTLIITTLIEKADGSTETIEIFSEGGDDLDDLAGEFVLASTGFLKDVSAYTLIVKFRSTSSSERVYFDEMLVFQPSE